MQRYNLIFRAVSQRCCPYFRPHGRQKNTTNIHDELQQSDGWLTILNIHLQQRGKKPEEGSFSVASPETEKRTIPFGFDKQDMDTVDSGIGARFLVDMCAQAILGLKEQVLCSSVFHACEQLSTVHKHSREKKVIFHDICADSVCKDVVGNKIEYYRCKIKNVEQPLK